MFGAFTIRRLIAVGALTAAWVALWGDISFANITAGILIGGAVTIPSIATDQRGRINPGALIRLITAVAFDLAQSTVAVAKETLTPTDSTDESIIAVTLPPNTEHHFTFLVVAITLTPGTAVVDIDRSSCTLYLHLLHHDRKDETVEHVRRLARLVCAALPSDELEPA